MQNLIVKQGMLDGRFFFKLVQGDRMLFVSWAKRIPKCLKERWKAEFIAGA